MLWDIFWCSEMLWGIFRFDCEYWAVRKRSIRFRAVLWCSGMFKGSPRCFHVFWAISKVLWRTWGVYWRCGVFWRFQRRSHGCGTILNCFTRVSVVPLMFRGVLWCFHGFWVVHKGYWRFWGVLWRSSMFRGLLRVSHRFWRVSGSFELFSDVLGFF